MNAIPTRVMDELMQFDFLRFILSEANYFLCEVTKGTSKKLAGFRLSIRNA